MSSKAPRFLSRQEIDEIHQRSIQEHGGSPGLRSDHLIESALAAPQHLHLYTEAEHFDIAGAYVFHIAESQAYLDGNKRTGIAAAMVYLETNGIDTSRLPQRKAYEVMIDLAAKRISRTELDEFFRSCLKRKSGKTREASS